MAVRFHCPECRKELRAPGDVRGRTVRCPSCSHQFRISGGQNAPAAHPRADAEPHTPRQSSARPKRTRRGASMELRNRQPSDRHRHRFALNDDDDDEFRFDGDEYGDDTEDDAYSETPRYPPRRRPRRKPAQSDSPSGTHPWLMPCLVAGGILLPISLFAGKPFWVTLMFMGIGAFSFFRGHNARITRHITNSMKSQLVTGVSEITGETAVMMGWGLQILGGVIFCVSALIYAALAAVALFNF